MIAPEGPRGPRGAIEGAAAASRRAPALGCGPAGAARAPPRSRQHQCYQGAVYCRARDFGWTLPRIAVAVTAWACRAGAVPAQGYDQRSPKAFTTSARFVKCSLCEVLVLCSARFVHWGVLALCPTCVHASAACALPDLLRLSHATGMLGPFRTAFVRRNFNLPLLIS